MFYHLDVLKKGGKFYICWVADCYPQKFLKLPERKIRNFDIPRSCVQLQDVIVTESNKPTKRFSLRLSSHLLMGIMRIYLRKVNILIMDVLHFQQDVHRAILNKQKPKAPKKPKATHQIELYEHEKPLEAVTLPELSAHIVRNAASITLQEATIPPTTIINDGFGDESDLEQVRNLEIASKSFLNISAMQGPGMSSRTLNDTHLGQLPLHKPGMLESSPNRDLTKVSALDVTNLPEIEIQEIPAAVPHEAPPDKTSIEAMAHSTPARPSVGRLIRQLQQDMQLGMEELLPQEEAGKRSRKRRRPPTRDAQTVIDGSVMRERQSNHNVEMRCQTAEEDRVNLSLVRLSPAADLLRTPCFLFGRTPARQSSHLTEIFHQRLLTRKIKFGFNDHVLQEIEAIRTAAVEKSAKHNKDLTKNQTADLHKTLLPIIEVPEVEKTVSEAKDMTANNQDVSLLPELQDITMLPNIDISSISKDLQIVGDEVNTSGKRGSLDGGGGRRKSARISGAERNREDAVPERMVVVVDVHRAMDSLPQVSAVPPAPAAEMEQVLELNMIQELPHDEVLLADASVREQSKDETGLGSLDRTQVDLGDEDSCSLRTKDAQQYLSENWGVKAVAKKVLIARMEGMRPITVHKLVSRFYSPPSDASDAPVVSRKQVAVRAFFTIIKLRMHDILQVVKRPDSLEIAHIRPGKRNETDAQSVPQQ